MPWNQAFVDLLAGVWRQNGLLLTVSLAVAGMMIACSPLIASARGLIGEPCSQAHVFREDAVFMGRRVSKQPLSPALRLPGWQNINAFAKAARQNRIMVFYSVLLAIGLNILGILDITLFSYFTMLAAPIKINPFLMGIVDFFPDTWLYMSLLLQATTTVSILWYPHPFFLLLISFRILTTFFVVIHNIGFMYAV